MLGENICHQIISFNKLLLKSKSIFRIHCSSFTEVLRLQHVPTLKSSRSNDLSSHSLPRCASTYHLIIPMIFEKL